MPPALLSTLLAQDTAKATLERALTSGRVHHAYLFDGPDGVGKERAALGLAQALVCEARTERGAAACGTCGACTRVSIRTSDSRPLHPDVILLERGLYAPEQIGRRTPETQDLSIDQVRTLVLARAAFPPHEGRARVFVVRRAEELSVPAANALLKTLEEPGDRTHFILLSARADSLLATIRSRAQRVRFGRLPDAAVERLLVGGGTPKEQAAAIAKLAHGSMTEAAILADPAVTQERDAFVQRVLAAMDSQGLGKVLEIAEDAKKQKDVLESHLQALAHELGALSCADVRAGASGLDAATRYQVVLRALGQLRGNASAQLVTESLLTRMRGV